MTAQTQIPILHFSNEIVRGGAEEHMLLLLKALDRRRFRLHLACPPELAEKLRPDLPGDVEIFSIVLNTPLDVRAALQFSRILRQRRIGILHSHMFHASMVASPIGRLSGVPVIMETPHVRELWRQGWKAWFWPDRLIGRFVDHFIAVSEANGRYLSGTKGLPKAKISVIQNGCDVGLFDPSHAQPQALRERLGVAPGEPIVVVLARLEPQKGHRVLLAALPEVCRQFPTVRVFCVGDGVLKEALEIETREQRMESHVRFVGFQTNAPDWLAMSDFSVLPSFYEGLPLAVIESLAAGRTVVATDVDGTAEVVADGRTGFTIPPGDPAALAEAICRMLRNPELRAAMGSAGRQLVMERFTRERQVQKTEQLYLTAYGRRGSPKSNSLTPRLVPSAHDH